jgi:hypothetical protein
MLVAVILFAVALVCYIVPTVVGITGAGWVAAGLLAMAVDFLVGGWVVPLNRRNP